MEDATVGRHLRQILSFHDVQMLLIIKVARAQVVRMRRASIRRIPITGRSADWCNYLAVDSCLVDLLFSSWFNCRPLWFKRSLHPSLSARVLERRLICLIHQWHPHPVPLAPSDGHIVDNDIFETGQRGIFEKQKKGCPEVELLGRIVRMSGIFSIG